MPKFLYTIFFLAVAAWLFFYTRLVYSAPDSFFNIGVFLLSLFVALSLTLSIPFYFFFNYKAPMFTKYRVMYRKALKWGIYLSFGIVGLLGLRAFNLFNPLNAGLFAALYTAVYFQLRSRGR